MPEVFYKMFPNITPCFPKIHLFKIKEKNIVQSQALQLTFFLTFSDFHVLTPSQQIIQFSNVDGFVSTMSHPTLSTRADIYRTRIAPPTTDTNDNDKDIDKDKDKAKDNNDANDEEVAQIIDSQADKDDLQGPTPDNQETMILEDSIQNIMTATIHRMTTRSSPTLPVDPESIAKYVVAHDSFFTAPVKNQLVSGYPDIFVIKDKCLQLVDSPNYDKGRVSPILNIIKACKAYTTK